MILSGKDIEAAVRNGEIGIEPFDTVQLKPASYVFTLGERLWRPAPTSPQPSPGHGRESFIDSREDVELEEIPFPADGYLLQPGGFVIGRTCERVKLNGKFMMQLDTRSSLAQMGLNVTQSSTWAEPETDNTFVLEISNQGELPVRLFPGNPKEQSSHDGNPKEQSSHDGNRIARGIFFRIS